MTDQPMTDERLTAAVMRAKKAEAERDSFQETANFWCDRAQEAQAERDAALARAEKAEAEVAELERERDAYKRQCEQWSPAPKEAESDD